jgi:hypothetical protein
MNWWDFVNVFMLFLLCATHFKQYYYLYWYSYFFIDIFVCLRLFDMMVDGVFVCL